MKKTLRHLLLVTLEDPYNPLSWSGTPYYMRLALEAKLERVSVLAKLKPRRSPIDVLLRAVLGHDRYPLYLTKAAQKQFALETEAAIRKHKPDAVLSISSHCLLYLNDPGIPVFMVVDAPWITWQETYQHFAKKMPLLGKRFGRLEAAAARHCTGLIFSSEWAAREAERLYGVPPEKLHVQPLGANWAPEISGVELTAAISARPKDRLDLLYVGKDWERKGGPLALEVARELKQAGVANVRLHIVGCRPEIPPDLVDVVEVYGLLRSSDPEQKQTLQKLFLESHFLIVPTQAECFGLVFAEAHAFGLPSISRAVHAVPSIVLDGETGILQAIDDPASKYVPRILALANDREAYLKMALAARARFENLLTWQPFAEGVVKVIEASLTA